ncbi:hypothetical protein DXG03_002127 [Asterophora parasitica]|uniref:Uncharacterized protein n=1 Tax=Asterophora parasitica TaxID=117018 RepID=A0A9P7G2C2_9AGAR|nr:hypothetical protein DXG03_002127 [Asterophora parasitica]
MLSSGLTPPSVSEAEELSPSGALSDTHSTSSSPNARPKDMFSGVIDRFKNLSLPGLGRISTASALEPLNGASDAYPSPANTIPTDEPGSAKLFPAGPSDEDRKPDPAEPTYLARKIQALIDALPLPSSPRPPTAPKQPNRDSSGRPIPPPGATPIKDSTLIAMLSSATVMNGRRVQEERERRVSVWSILDSMDPHRQGDGNEREGGEEGTGEDDGSGSGDGGSVFDDASGIMMYSPLMPTTESLVEIAESGIIDPLSVEDGPDPSEAEHVAGWMGMWPFSLWGAGTSAPSTGQSVLPIAPVTTSPRPASPVSSLPLSPPGSPRSTRIRIPGQRVWVPSTTKLSFQAMWWGYRLYLPPPIMEILDDKQIEAAKRAALITSALTWFFGHIPVNALPPSVRPVVLLMQTLIPYIGYIGTFISWSWGTIKSYDKDTKTRFSRAWCNSHCYVAPLPPPPPPSPPTIPLPDFEEVPLLPVQASPRFGLRVLGKGKDKDKDKRNNKDKSGGSRDGERKKEKGKAKFKTMVSSPFSGSKSVN